MQPHPSPFQFTIDIPIYNSKKKSIGYEQLQKAPQGTFSAGERQFPYSKPPPEYRTSSLPSMEKLIERMKSTIKADLFRLFGNSYPNVLRDTMIKWRGYATAIDPASTNERLWMN
jgi:hypothetical protein